MSDIVPDPDPGPPGPPLVVDCATGDLHTAADQAAAEALAVQLTESAPARLAELAAQQAAAAEAAAQQAAEVAAQADAARQQALAVVTAAAETDPVMAALLTALGLSPSPTMAPPTPPS